MSLSHLLSRGGLVICGILIAKYFDSVSFANYSYLVLTVTTVAIYSAVGVGVTTTKFYANLRIDENSPIFLLGIMSFVFAIIGSILFLVFSDLIIPSSINNQLYVIFLIIFFMSIDIYANNALIGLGEFKRLFYGSFLAIIINFIALILSILRNDIYYSICGLLFSVFMQLILNIIFLIISLPKDIIVKNIGINKNNFLKIGKTMGPMMVVSLLAASGTWIIGRFIINNSSSGLVEFALFSIGLQWYSLALFIPTMISKVLLPSLIKGGAKDKTLYYNCIYVICFCIFLAFFSYLIHPLISEFYGEEYNIPYFYIPIFFIVAGLNSCCNILGNKIISSNNELIWSFIIISSFLVIIFSCLNFSDLGANLGWVALVLGNVTTLILILIFFISRMIINKKGF